MSTGENFSVKLTQEGRFAKRLKLLRSSAKLSQEELASRANLDRSYISLIECGKKSPTVATLDRIAAALRCKVRDFFD